ncbi:uncharacterized protein [Drosophila tropicalis]|uniref:uncharacterized protein n=1 Tax=Drosophila tropicalis TaxID=46794 RepID=UPI0035ABC11A
MKFFMFVALALLGYAAAAQLPDSATQGPNPQDIATPEPEYIDIEEPAPVARAPAPAPLPVAASAPVPIARPVVARPVARPVAAVTHQQFIQPQPIQQLVQRAQYLPPQVGPQLVQQQLPGHSFSSKSGYQYRRPVYVRRFYRLRRY